jgi:hypothetical protein
MDAVLTMFAVSVLGGLLPIDDVRTGTVCTTTSDERGGGQTATSVDLVRHRRSILRPQTETLLNSYKTAWPDIASAFRTSGRARIRLAVIESGPVACGT